MAQHVSRAPRNPVARALAKRQAGSGAHGASEKAERRAAEMTLRRQIGDAIADRLTAPALTADRFAAEGYTEVRQLDDGTWAGLIPLITTTGLCLALHDGGYARRFCFKDHARAVAELGKLGGCLDEPTGWIARRPE